MPQRPRVFLSSVLQELEMERAAARQVIQKLGLAPVTFEAGARPHPPRQLYQAYLEQSQLFVGIYGQRYGWVAPGTEISGLEDELRLWGSRPRLIYVKEPTPEREPRLAELLKSLQDDNTPARSFASVVELERLMGADLTEFASRSPVPAEPTPPETPGQAERLPSPSTSLIGREDEIAALLDIVVQLRQRLVTLFGPAGVGKTRLAIEVARRLEGGFEGGARFVPLSTLSDPALLPQSVARVFGLMEASRRPLFQSLTEHLRGQRLLLVLDGFEAVLEAAQVVAELLAQAPQLQILVTSRAVLRVFDETGFAVRPLELPPSGAPQGVENLAHNEAVQLFVERARVVKPGFALTPENAPVVAEICRRLDGLPLAIELAAVHIKMLSPQMLLKRLSSRLGTLTEGPRDLPARQRTLRTAFDWSYRLLSPQEQTLFARLAVFVEGSTLEALEAVCQEPGEPELLEPLLGLVEKSLIEQREGPQEPRFLMLETLREYALEKLGASEEASTLRQRHAEYFLELAEAAHRARPGPTQTAWLTRLEAEQANHRAALTWLLEGRQVEGALRLASALTWFWDLRGRFSEGRRWLGAALKLGEEVPPLVRASALLGSGILAWRQGDYAVARPLMEESLALARTHGEQGLVAYALQNLGNLATHQGDFTAARAYQDENLELRRKLPDKAGLADALFSRGNVALVEGEMAQAKELYQESLALYQEVGDTLGLPFVLINLAEVARFGGDYSAAQNQAEQARKLAEELGDRLRQANALQSLGLSARDQSQVSAQELLQQSLAIYRELGHGLKIGFVTSELGTVMLQRGELAQAEALFSEGLQTHRALSLDPGIAYALLGLAEVARARADYALAIQRLREGLPLALRTTDRLTLARYLETLAFLPPLRAEAAARLLGTASALRQAAGTPLSPAERPGYEAGRAEVQARLEASSFQALWSEGEMLSPEQAAAEVLGTETNPQP